MATSALMLLSIETICSCSYLLWHDLRHVWFISKAQGSKGWSQYWNQEKGKLLPCIMMSHVSMQTMRPAVHGEPSLKPEIKHDWCINIYSVCRLRKYEQPLCKKGRRRLIHISDFINSITGCLIIEDENGTVQQDAWVIIYPGTNGDAWWDTDQLLRQVREAIKIFEARHPGKQALFIFDQSSAHASLPPDALKAFEMNKTDGGKQRKRCDTVIPMTNPCVEHRGKAQAMTLPDGRPKGLQTVLTEHGFEVQQLWAKCSPVCPIESQNCCMAHLLSQQEDFRNQPSMLETLITDAGHECIFLPKFHCELNPIEMVCSILLLSFNSH
jgi:hypothetical protein